MKKQIVLGIGNGHPYIIDNPTDYDIVIKDYDVEGMEDLVLETDEDGDKYHQIKL